MQAAIAYETERFGLGSRFEGELDRVLSRIAQSPLQFSAIDVRSGGTMRLLLLLTIMTACTADAPSRGSSSADSSGAVTMTASVEERVPAPSAESSAASPHASATSALPARVKWLDVSTDPSFVWLAGRPRLSVEVLFDQHGSTAFRGEPPRTGVHLGDARWTDPPAPLFDFGEVLFNRLAACKTTEGVAIGRPGAGSTDDLSLRALTLGVGETVVERKWLAASCLQQIPVKHFYKEGWSYDVTNERIVDRVVAGEVQARVGTVTITYRGTHCDDTGVHDVRIRTTTGTLAFRDMLNVDLFEADLDSDGAAELIVVSAQACGGWVRIYRVKSKPEP